MTHFRNQLLKPLKFPSKKVRSTVSHNAAEEKASIVKNTAAPEYPLCVKHRNEIPELKYLNEKDSQCGIYKMVLDNHKEAASNHRDQKQGENLAAPSGNMSKHPSFHDTIQQCISELPTINSIEANKHEISGEKNSAHSISNSKLLPDSEKLSICCQTGVHSDSCLTNPGHIMNRNPNKTRNCLPTLGMKKYQHHNQTVKVTTPKAQITSARIAHAVSSGNENVIQIKNTFGFPAFHPHPLKIPFYSTILRTHFDRDQKNNFTEKCNYYPGSLLRQPSENRRELITPESDVTLGDVLHIMRNDLKKAKNSAKYISR
ncbi:uncharacterized protein LOC115100359 isoform X2 [Rhinatrema bivittatum]|nr:uncharacterized protein LOC115100359 isoform X2 [Rhinatrema bivittatum]XP_029474638.1 uncharacterized protein LOC115100359 isoform X2 [Rhinatrema bivittatum]